VVLKRSSKNIVAVVASALTIGTPGSAPCWAQANSDRAVFQEEQQMMQTNQNQEQQLEREKQQYQSEVSREDAQSEPYRLYAEKRIEELNKLKAAGGSPSRSLAAQKSGEFYALEKWLTADAQARAEEQGRLKQLDQAIVNLQTSQTATMSNMGSDIQAMREDSQLAAQNQKFQQQMQINQFNELQSEMGAASWGRPPQDGTFNSVGGYGMGGGYGYSYGGGRRAGW
jgi:hypothetical protein